MLRLHIGHVTQTIFELACSDALIKDKSRLRVDLQDVKLFDPDLGACLQRAPTEYLPLVSSNNVLLCTTFLAGLHAAGKQVCQCWYCSLKRQPKSVFSGVTGKRMRVHKYPAIYKSFSTVLLSLAHHP